MSSLALALHLCVLMRCGSHVCCVCPKKFVPVHAPLIDSHFLQCTCAVTFSTMFIAFIAISLTLSSSYSRPPYFSTTNNNGEFFLAQPLKVTSEGFTNITDPVNTIALNRIDRGLKSRQTCTKPGYSNCEGSETQCCPSGGTCCIFKQSTVVGEPRILNIN